MATLSLRIADSLHKQAKLLAEEEGVSINQIISTALAEKISALKTEEMLESRAARASEAAFRNALGEVPSAEPLAGDEWAPRKKRSGSKR